jgi:hypothetical protein
MSLYLASVARNPDLEQGTCFCDVYSSLLEALESAKPRNLEGNAAWALLHFGFDHIQNRTTSSA